MLALLADTAGSTRGNIQVVLSSLPTVLAILCGVAATHVTDLLTHARAPQLVKSGVNFGLTALAGVLLTVQLTDGHTWKEYVALVFSAWAASLVTHVAGFTGWVQRATGGVGIGAPSTAAHAPQYASPSGPIPDVSRGASGSGTPPPE